MARYWSISAVPVSAHPRPLVITTKLAAAIYGGAANNKYKYSSQYCPCGPPPSPHDEKRNITSRVKTLVSRATDADSHCNASQLSHFVVVIINSVSTVKTQLTSDRSTDNRAQKASDLLSTMRLLCGAVVQVI